MATTQTIVSANGGILSRSPSFYNAGGAADFPAFNVSTNPAAPRAVLAVMESTTAGTALNPQTAVFSFGADFRLDSGTTATSGSTDNGNNIMQRGLASGVQPQFKIQADFDANGALRITCEMRNQGLQAVTARTTGAVSPGAWYRAKCTRTPGAPNDTVTLSVRPINATTGALGTAILTTTGAGPLGDMNFANGIPLSVGGKLYPASGAQPVRVALDASDQFNGLIDNAILNIAN